MEIFGHAISRLVGVDELPVLGWIAPIEEGIVVIEGRSIVKVEELSTTAVKVLSEHKGQ
jgi:hypothetical protein